MITIQATGDTTLRTAGKYCEEDILVKVPSSGGGVSLPQLSNEGGPEDLVEGKELINSSGNIVVGTNPYEKVATDSEVQHQADLLSQAIEALKEKAVPEENLDEELSTQELLISTQDSKIKELIQILNNKKASGTSTVRIYLKDSKVSEDYWDESHNAYETIDLSCQYLDEKFQKQQKRIDLNIYTGNFDVSEMCFTVPTNSTILINNFAHSHNIDILHSDFNSDFYDLDYYTSDGYIFPSPFLDGQFYDSYGEHWYIIPIFGNTEIRFAEQQEV